MRFEHDSKTKALGRIRGKIEEIKIEARGLDSRYLDTAIVFLTHLVDIMIQASSPKITLTEDEAKPYLEWIEKHSNHISNVYNVDTSEGDGDGKR